MNELTFGQNMFEEGRKRLPVEDELDKLTEPEEDFEKILEERINAFKNGLFAPTNFSFNQK